MGELFLSFLSKLIALLSFILLFQSCWFQTVTTESSEGEILMDLSCSNNDTRLPDDEVEALETLVDKLGYQSNSNRDGRMNDTRSSPICNCSCTNNVCHVTNITMESLKLGGTIDGEALSKLQYLEYLDLSENRIHGIIPPTVNNLTSLRHIFLSSNQLHGPLPNMQNMKNLVGIFFALNFLGGIIPQSLGQLSSLKYLYLGVNLFTGEIPAELGNLSKLEYLRLEENLLEGKLTPALGKLQNLNILTVGSNNLTGILPNEYANLKRLFAFMVDGNNFSGRIPKYITKWNQLQELYLLGNEFESLPLGIFNMSELRYLAVSDVNIRGSSLEMPKLINLKNIKELIIRNCSFTGVIPASIGNCPNLTYLDLSFNKLADGIPKSMENLMLDFLILTSNMLSGTVNHSWIKKMELADLSFNNYTSMFPAKNMF